MYAGRRDIGRSYKAMKRWMDGRTDGQFEGMDRRRNVQTHGMVNRDVSVRVW